MMSVALNMRNWWKCSGDKLWSEAIKFPCSRQQMWLLQWEPCFSDLITFGVLSILEFKKYFFDITLEKRLILAEHFNLFFNSKLDVLFTIVFKNFSRINLQESTSVSTCLSLTSSLSFTSSCLSFKGEQTAY